MFYDYHMHSSFSTDGKSTMEEMIKKSIELGLNEICFTDHVDYDVYADDSFSIVYEDYFKSLETLQNKYKDKISIKKGIEFGVQTQLMDTYRKEANQYPLDFIICSIHAIDTMDLYLGNYFKDKTQHEVYENYYLYLYNIVKNYKDYSILGHLDLIKRYAPYDTILDDTLFSDIIEEILKQAIYDGKGIEINTSCYRYNLPDLTPSRYILQMYKDLGGEIITTGSDSHHVSQIAYEFDYIYTLLKNMGFKYVSKFNKLKPEFIKL